MISIDEINRLKAENKELNDIIDGYQPKLQALKDENKQLKELFEIESLTDIKTGETMYRSRQIIHFVDILQEIKAIAESPKPFIDFSEIKTATEVEYDYTAICNELELRLHKVLEKITKAEEE